MRNVVHNLLLRTSKGAYSQIILDSELKKCADVQSRAFVTALFYGVTERQITLDYVLEKFTKLSRCEHSVIVLLRMAAYQLLYMDGVPDRAAIYETVELAPKRAKSYVNGVLRALQRSLNNDEDKRALLSELDGNLSLKYSCPEWLVQKWLAEYGEEVTLEILRTSLLPPPVFHIEGTDIPQDLSSQKACELLNPQPGETIIDVCAAPGGKSIAIARLMSNTGSIFCGDINRKKLERIDKTAKLLGLTCLTTLVNDAKIFNPDLPTADRVLCDVPCSGFGVIRRKPEIKYKNPSDLTELPEIQFQILQTSSRYVRDDGYLMYSTCTLSRAENDEIAEKFITESNNFALIDKKTIIPSKNGGDGFFMALMKKKTKNEN